MPRPPLTNSTFHMLRCVVMVLHADRKLEAGEMALVRMLIANVQQDATFMPQQKRILKEDIKKPQNIDELLPHVTTRADREKLVLFAGLMAMADGEMHPDEEAILKKIQNHCGENANLPATAQASVPAFDKAAFATEVRDIVRQEMYRKTMESSGVRPGMRAAAVVDAAFADRSAVAGDEDARQVLEKMPRLGYITRRNLVPGERVVAKAEVHWIYFLKTFLFCGLLIAAAFFVKTHAVQVIEAVYNVADATPLRDVAYRALSSPWALKAPTLLLYATAAVFFAWRILHWLAMEIVLTDRRMLIKIGVFRGRMHTLSFAELGKTAVDQFILGKILDYGVIDGVNDYQDPQTGKRLSLPAIADPHGFISMVDRAERMWRMGHGGNVTNVRAVRN
jgi:hypothetical protein